MEHFSTGSQRSNPGVNIAISDGPNSMVTGTCIDDPGGKNTASERIRVGLGEGLICIALTT